MSNYSVKLTKCGKCQFSSAHLPSRVAVCARHLRVNRRAEATGPRAGGLAGGGGHRTGHAKVRGPGSLGPGDMDGAVGMLLRGPREGREPLPDQMARMLNY